MQVDTQETFDLRMAASVVDNHFSPAVPRFICQENSLGESAFYTVLDETQKRIIQERPELCVVIPVTCY